MKSKGIRSAAVLLAVLVVVPGSSWAFGGPPGGGRMGPPLEAIEACKDKTEGTVVEFTTRHGDKVKATCRMMAVPEGPAGKNGASHLSGRVEEMAAALGLSDDQKTKISAILKAEWEKSDPIRQQIGKNREQLRQASLAVPFDEATVRAVAAKQAQLETELMVSRARVQSQINALLTPEQRTLAEKLRPEMGPQPGHMPRFGYED